jgi:F-type H+-transporting ATPase subunit b
MELFKNNLFNWLILVGVIVWMWNKFMPAVFDERRRKILAAIDESRKAREEGTSFLAQQKDRIDNAEKDAEKILVEARQMAEQLKQQLAEQTRKDAADLERKIDQQIATHRQMVITELRSSAATVAVRLAEASLPGAITDNVKKGLQERFVSQFDSTGGGIK